MIPRKHAQQRPPERGTNGTGGNLRPRFLDGVRRVEDVAEVLQLLSGPDEVASYVGQGGAAPSVTEGMAVHSKHVRCGLGNGMQHLDASAVRHTIVGLHSTITHTECIASGDDTDAACSLACIDSHNSETPCFTTSTEAGLGSAYPKAQSASKI